MYLFSLPKAYLKDVREGLQTGGEGRAVISDPGTSEKVDWQGWSPGEEGRWHC